MKTIVYVFQCNEDSSWFCFTNDQKENSCPQNEVCKTWTSIKTIEVGPDDSPRLGVGSIEILDGINTKGYYTSQVKISFDER